jgi:hypothetical protein
LVTVTGGSGSYTYSWVYVSGVSMGINGNTSNNASASYGSGVADTYVMTIECHVTDTVYARTVTTNTVRCQITLSN